MLDLDGTLVDTMDALARLAAEVLRESHAMDFADAREAYVETSGVPFRAQLDLILPGERRLDEAADAFETRKVAIARGAELSVPRLHALECLREQGYRLTVSSSSAHHLVEDFRRRAGFAFDLVLGFGPGQTKGARHFAMTCEALGVTRDQLVFVGDSLTDAALAAESEVAFIGRVGTFSRSRFSAEHPSVELIDDVVELPGLLGARDA